MKIGIDARFYGKAGPGRYTKNIIQHLEKVDIENDYVIFLTKDGYRDYEPASARFVKILADHRWYSFDEQTRFLLKIAKEKLDLYFVPHFNIPVLYPGKIVTAIPDMTMHTFSTEKGTTLPSWYFRIKMIIYKFVFWWAVYRSYKVIVPSVDVLNDFLKHLKFSKDKYVLAYEGIDPDLLKKVENSENIKEKFKISNRFILSVGSMYEHKNVEGMIEAFKILKNDYKYDGQLVFASKRDKFSERIFEKVKLEGLYGDIKVLAYLSDKKDEEIVISDKEVIALRMQAEAYLMASFKEGFSLTALEGMVFGLPAALSDIECHREVYGDAVLYFNPSDPKDMANKLNTLVSNKELRELYIARGLELVKKYDWLATAKTTLEVFNNALKK